MLDAGSHARLIYCRLGGQDWQFSNVTANATYQFIGPTTTGLNLTNTGDPKTFELRVTNWAYGIQLAGVSVAADAKISRVPEYPKMVEVIGDS
jgi:hypothetical protein